MELLELEPTLERELGLGLDRTVDEREGLDRTVDEREGLERTVDDGLEGRDDCIFCDPDDLDWLF